MLIFKYLHLLSCTMKFYIHLQNIVSHILIILIMTPEKYFKSVQSVNKKRYDALYDFFVNHLSASEVAAKYGYTLLTFYSVIRDFRQYLKECHQEDYFFKNNTLGRKPSLDQTLKDWIISLRKKNFAMEEIVCMVNAKGYNVS